MLLGLLCAVAAIWSPPTQISSEPRIYVIDNFATAEECAEIYATAAPKLEESLTTAGGAQADTKPKGRSSQQYTINPKSFTSNIAAVVERMDAASLMPAANGQVKTGRHFVFCQSLFSTSPHHLTIACCLLCPPAQHLTVTNYGHDDHYEVHVDSNLAVGRLLTALLFLEQPDEGGELIFPWAKPKNRTSCPAQGIGSWPEGVHGTGRSFADYYALSTLPRLEEVGMCAAPTEALRIEPRVGRLVLFFNHDYEGRMLRPTTLHGSCPVKKGAKRIAQRWYMWHDLSAPNALGALLERVHGPTAWKVDYRLVMDAEAREQRLRDCEDAGPFECKEAECPSAQLSCLALAEMDTCQLGFTEVWATPPEGTASHKVRDLCPKACGRC